MDSSGSGIEPGAREALGCVPARVSGGRALLIYSAGSKVGSLKGAFWLSLEGFRLLLLVGNVGGVEDMAFVSGRVCVVRGSW